jgi:hypothetical protein
MADSMKMLPTESGAVEQCREGRRSASRPGECDCLATPWRASRGRRDQWSSTDEVGDLCIGVYFRCSRGARRLQLVGALTVFIQV